MDIKCLRTFQAVVACGTYAKAADRLGYTQSTVTVHIKQLERDLGLPLFERIGRRMVLTQKGAEALAQAAEIIAAADRLAALGTEETALQGTLRVDLAETLLCYALDEVIAAFRERAPGVALRLRARTCAQGSENLRAGCAAAGNALEHCSGAVETPSICATLREHGALTAQMTGSGAAVFGVFDDETAARNALAALRPSYKQCYLCRPTHGGPRVTVRRQMFEKK